MPVSVSYKSAKPKIQKKTVKGKDLKEVLKALNRMPEWGLYDSTQNQKNGAKTDGNGKIVSVSINLNPIITMPQWSGYSKATKPQKASWDTMYKALLKHEMGHHAVQLKCGEEFKRQVSKKEPMEPQAIKTLLEEHRKACQKKQDAYDTTTKHGKTQGVVLDTSA